MADLGLPPPIVFNTNLLIDVFAARSAQNLARTFNPQTASFGRKPDTSVPPPWDPAAKPLGLEEILRKTLARGVFFENNLGAFSNSAAPADQKKLFALYSGVNKLAALATDASDKTTTDARRRFLNNRFAGGATQLSSFLSATQFGELSFLKGEKLSSAKSTLQIGRGTSTFTTGVIQDGPFDAPVASLAGTVQFAITAKKLGGDVVVNLDLADMGATPRTLDNVANYINGKLVAAGLVTTVKREKIGTPDVNGIIPGSQFGLEFTGVSSEPLSFSSPNSTPTIYTVGTSGFGGSQGVQFIRYNDQVGAAPQVAFSQRIETTEGTPSSALAIKTGANGEIYVLSQSGGTTGGLTPRGTQDVFLTKYDSTGREVFTRGLGASASASGLALAVGADGSVVVAGKVSGALGTTTDLGGEDAFVTKFDAAGQEVFIKRFGGSGNDDVRSIALAADGTVYLAGRTRSPLTGTQGGGDDGFVRALSTTGATLYTRQFGGAGDESANAIALDANGDLLVASVEGGNGILRKFSAADGVSAAIYTKDLGALDGGTLSAITLDGTGIVLAGSAGAANGLGGTAVNAHAGARDGFVVRLDEDLAGQPIQTYTTFLGTSGGDRIRDVVASGGNIYLTGSTTGSLPGGGVLNGTENTFSAVLNAGTGAEIGVTQVSGRGGFSSGAGIAVDNQGASILDALGLPRGDVLYADSRVITDRSLARPGDSFLISVDGGVKRKIRVDATDNYRALTFKINAVTVLNGQARVVRGSDGDTLKITPTVGHTIELFAGPKGQDLLSALGFPEGVVRVDPVKSNKNSTSSAPPIYGLGIGSGLDLSTLSGAKAAETVLQAALTTIRSAYRTLTLDPALKDLLNGKGKGINGPVPAYLSRQIANYSAGLARLQSGGGGGFIV
ncbi:MAG: hypothetical protein COA84_03555 [Robiginitomaculum sp.]|nr:MAG: hypothetical protein COA84_03555 [Robiginitomaculum sp.]